MSSEDKAKNVKKERLIKIVLRRLPHGMTDEELLKQLDPLSENVQDHWFIEADLELLPFAYARAYFVFNNSAEAIAFCDRFSGYVFVDKQGNESSAIAEQAPCQLIPNKGSVNKDRKVNTLESDSEYLKFLEKHSSANPKKVTDFDKLLKELHEKHKATTFVRQTPLTEFVRMKQSAPREKKRGVRNEKFGSSRRSERSSSSRSERSERKNEQIPPKFNNENASSGKERKRRPRSEKSSRKIDLDRNGDEKPDGRTNNNGDKGKSDIIDPHKVKVLTNKNKTESQGRSPSANVVNDSPKETKAVKEENNSKRDNRDAPRRNKFRPERPIYQPGNRSKVAATNSTNVSQNNGS